MPFADVATFDRVEPDPAATYDTADLKTIPPGVPGTRATAEEVEANVRRAVRSPEVAELAEYILNRFGARPYNEPSQVRAVHQALARGMFYARDPRGVETIRDARKMARKMLLYFQGRGVRPIGDCDDYTSLGRAVLEFVGFKTKSRVVGTKRPGVYNHIYPMVQLSSGTWMGLEATIPGARVGWAPESTTVAPMDVPNIGQVVPVMPTGPSYDRWWRMIGWRAGLPYRPRAPEYHGVGQGAVLTPEEERSLNPMERAAVRVMRATLPETMERTARPAVEELTRQARYVKWPLLALAALFSAMTYDYFARSRARWRAA